MDIFYLRNGIVEPVSNIFLLLKKKSKKFNQNNLKLKNNFGSRLFIEVDILPQSGWESQYPGINTKRPLQCINHYIPFSLQNKISALQDQYKSSIYILTVNHLKVGIFYIMIKLYMLFIFSPPLMRKYAVSFIMSSFFVVWIHITCTIDVTLL